jgi:hypothetical protein
MTFELSGNPFQNGPVNYQALKKMQPKKLSPGMLPGDI